MKILSFDRDGYWIWSKRLELGRFEELTGVGKRPLTRTGLLALLDGVDVDVRASAWGGQGGLTGRFEPRWRGWTVPAMATTLRTVVPVPEGTRSWRWTPRQPRFRRRTRRGRRRTCWNAPWRT